MQPLNLVPRRKRGNPTWGKSGRMPIVRSDWSMLLEDIGMDERAASDDPQSAALHPLVRKFVKRHANKKYIPEGVLRACGVTGPLDSTEAF